jgi:isoleucyl-tRNA synthetase
MTGSKEPEILDKWVRAGTKDLVSAVSGYLDAYDTVRATREIERYVNDLSTWYVRRSRGRKDHEFFAALYECLMTLAKVMAPVTPYVSDKIYLTLAGQTGSVHLTDWPEAEELTREEKKLLEGMAEVREVVEKVHALRAEAGIKLRQPVGALVLPKNELLTSNSELLNILKDEVNVKEIVDGKELKLDTDITLELKIEGMAAELTRQINNFRKESGLKIGDMAEVYYETGSDELERAMSLVDKNKVYASEIKPGKPEQAEHEIEIEIEGNKVKFFLKIPNHK